ncbi:MAG: LysR family transcriptional regulator [Clostridia bacterium]|nr:LysR family transcriptional regulator [Clostridia bacterium]
MINLELYKIFKIVAEEENITKASERLNISQPAVTKHIHNLEALLNEKLFDRYNKGLRLTKVGKKIYNEIKEPLVVLEKIESKYGNQKNINLGTHVTVFNKILGKNLAQYCKKYSNVKVNIDRSDLPDLLLKLENQKIDIIVSKKDENYTNDNIEFIKLTDLHDILIVNSEYNKFKKIVTLEDLKDKIIYMPRKSSITTINFFESIKDLTNNSINYNNINYRTMLEMLKYDNNIGLVTKEAVLDEIERKEFDELNTEFKIKPVEYGIYVNNKNRFKELNNLIKELENIL